MEERNEEKIRIIVTSSISSGTLVGSPLPRIQYLTLKTTSENPGNSRKRAQKDSFLKFYS